MTDRTIRGPGDLDGLRFDDDGLVPVVTQDASAGTVLMVAWAHRAALERTLETGRMHYWSRSRQALWDKGATSGNAQAVVSLHADCDGDTVLARVTPAGPACHTGETTCFGDGTRSGPASGSPEAPPPGPRGSADGTLDALWRTLVERRDASPGSSYTARLLADENLRIKKIGEEAAELVHALAAGPGERVPEEAADLLYHVLVALLGAGATLDEVLAVLDRRRNRPRGDG